jgi:hypothetical protein
MAMGYYQIEFKESDKIKTAFSTRQGQFQFTRMPFGLCSAPATFQRVMSSILRDFSWKTCLLYLDDILVFGNNLENHNTRLRSILQRFREANIKLSPSKCVFMRQSVKYLGHIISADGISTDPDKVAAVKNWPTPNNLKELQAFMGLIGYYRKFINHYAEKTKVLQDLMTFAANNKVRKLWKWDKIHQECFIMMKNLLISTPILSYPMTDCMFILDTDACFNSTGAVLSQLQNGEEKIIEYASNILTTAEQKYCITRKELFAIYRYVKLYKHYLLGRKFIIVPYNGFLIGKNHQQRNIVLG